MSEFRKIVLSGEVVGDLKKQKSGYGTFEEDGKIISKFVGLPKESNDYVSVIPLSGVYIPKRHDKIIGFITSVERVGWTIDINSPWLAFLSLSEGVDDFVDLKKTDITRFYDVGDVIYTQIENVKKGDIQLTMNNPIARKLKGGITIKISPNKVPRLIGKEGSMINTIKDMTKTIIRVGQNGVVWVSGEDIKKAIKAIRMVDEKSHIIGLTDKITKLLSD